MLKCIFGTALLTDHDTTRKGVLTKDINTAIICIGLHGSLHCNYFAVFGRVPTDSNTERSHVCHQSLLSVTQMC